METVNCYICNKSTYSVILESYSLLYKERYTIVECDCGFKYLNPRPTERDIGSYYAKTDYHPHSRAKGLFFYLYILARKITFKWKLMIVNSYYPDKNIVHLDYGSGDNSFVRYMKSNGYDSTGFDPINNITGASDTISKKINLVTFWHSLEHIHNLDSVFNFLSKSLDENGVIFVAVPNFNSIDRKYLEGEWAAYDLPKHLYHFDPVTLEQLFYSNNYKLIDKKKMYLDTIYVSILSYINSSKISLLRILYIMFVSLVYILRGSPDCSSSLFYVFKKNNI